MNPTQARTLRDILRTQQIAALGTLHKGQPYVSMVPFALLRGGEGFVIHVSQLATHTKDMLSDPQVSLMVVAPPAPEVSAQATPRVTVQGQAAPCPESAPSHAQAKAAYLSRFPQSAEMFTFADFSLFVIQPQSVRFVAGFAQATTLAPEALAQALNG
jgi:putative heme iron utilization protein